MGLKRGTQRGSVFRFGGIRGDPRWAAGPPLGTEGPVICSPFGCSSSKRRATASGLSPSDPGWSGGGEGTGFIGHICGTTAHCGLSELMLTSAKEPC